ncbi:MAG: NUDIX domain-containing protein [Planctomycetota bacterium]|nr:NUDIX domain-containing protein [Planctomycetota bacterium]
MSIRSQAGRRAGVIAMIRRDQRWLVIRRAATVEAPGACCFAGGGIEPGESESEALCREVAEELGVQAEPVRKLWESTTSWGVELAWWLVSVPATAQIAANPREVAAVYWLTLEEILALPDLLSSNREFLEAWRQGTFALPSSQ